MFRVKGPNFVPAPNFAIPMVAFSVSSGGKCCSSIRQYSGRLASNRLGVCVFAKENKIFETARYS